MSIPFFLFFFSLLCDRPSRIAVHFSAMPKLSLSVRFAAASVLGLSVVHVLFWIAVAVALRALPRSYPDTLLFPVSCIFSAVGLTGVFVAVGLFRVRSWARIAALVLAALAAAYCALGLLALLLVRVAGTAASLGIEVSADSERYFVGLGVAYFVA